MNQLSCPGCHTEVHPLLASAPLVLGQRVVMCCSEACRDRVRQGQVAPASGAPRGSAEAEESVVAPSAPLSPPVASDAPDQPVGEATDDNRVEAAAKATDRPLEAPSPAALRRRRRGRSMLVVTGAVLMAFAGYLILSHTYGSAGSAPRTSLAAALPRLASPPPAKPADPAPAGQVVSRPPPAPPPTAQRPGLMTLKKQSWSVLEGFLASRTGRFWRTAARVLAEQGHAGALTALRKALKSTSWANRQRAAEALARLGHAEGLEVLKKDLTARRRPVKWASAFALARCGDAAGLRLIKQLANYRQHRMTAYEALVRLGDTKGMVHLRKVLSSTPAPYDRLRAAVALGMRGDRSGLPVLRARMKEPGMHMGVALALQKLGAPEARPALIRALEHTALREEAARALRAYGDVTLVAKMAPELRSDSEESRLTAAAAIVILTQAQAEVR